MACPVATRRFALFIRRKRVPLEALARFRASSASGRDERPCFFGEADPFAATAGTYSHPLLHFRDGRPVGIIDFDAAAPGQRLRDRGYAIFLWLNLGTDGPPPGEQARRVKLFCDGYGVEAEHDVIAAIVEAVAANIERLRAWERLTDVEWWQAQFDWLTGHRAELDGLIADQRPPELLELARRPAQ